MVFQPQKKRLLLILNLLPNENNVRSFLTHCVLNIILAMCISSCGYQWGHGGSISACRTISIPYVGGDWDGNLTSALVKQLSQSSPLIYLPSGGDLILQVKIVDSSSDNIGFRYDHNKDGHAKKSVIPDETRWTMWVEVQMIEAATGEIVLGPARLYADVEFDHDYYSMRNDINVKSLGQLTDVDDAYDAAEKPLNRRLAQKIVDYINDNW